MPMDTIRFANLNDNVDRKFLHELCEAYGDIKEYKVYCDPKTNAHLGTGKVVFDEGTDVTNVATALNGRQVMGKIVTAYIEIKSISSMYFLISLLYLFSIVILSIINLYYSLLFFEHSIK